MTAIDSVIFDCDGVLVDSEVISNRVLAEVLTQAGLPTTTEQSVALFKGRAWAQNLAVIEERMGGAAPADLTERYRAARDAELEAAVVPVDGIVEALDAIDLPSCVASSGDHAKMRLTLGVTGLYERFAGRIFSAVDIGGKGKPAPDLFLYAAERMGFVPERTAVVEDSVPGVVAGVAAGMTVLAYATNGEAPALAEAGGHVFTDMRELPGLLVPSGP
jgi:HAD superfamily hydrolase (TIGR01509 family)